MSIQELKDSYNVDLCNSVVSFHIITININVSTSEISLTCTEVKSEPVTANKQPADLCDFIAKGFSANSKMFYESNGLDWAKNSASTQIKRNLAYNSSTISISMYCLPQSLEKAKIELQRKVFLTLAAVTREIEEKAVRMREAVTLAISDINN